MRSVYR